ncbi:MAG: hypothetical protein ACKPGI_05565, partial [Verrucomicrobiota bacterium]
MDSITNPALVKTYGFETFPESLPMPAYPSTGHEFTTVFGRNLVAEIPNIALRPCLVVTMEDL